MDCDLRIPRDTTQQIDIARHEWTLRDDHDRKPGVFSEHLEHAPRNAEPPLRRLIRIGCRPNDDAFLAEQCEVPIRSVAERPAQYVGGVFLDEDSPLERQP